MTSNQVKRYRERFQKVWNSAKNPREAAKKLGLTYGSVRQMSYVYRKLGMKLKWYGQGTGTEAHSARARQRMEAFKKVWNACSTRAEAAEKLGLSMETASARAVTYRRRYGVELKKFYYRPVNQKWTRKMRQAARQRVFDRQANPAWRKMWLRKLRVGLRQYHAA